jgi:hypothetical protein
MQDGNPNGYYVMTFKGTTVKPKFIPGKGDPNESMRIVLDPLPLGTGFEVLPAPPAAMSIMAAERALDEPAMPTDKEAPLPD